MGIGFFHPILRQIDHPLQMLHPQTNGKCFRLHHNLLFPQSSKGIPRTVPDGQYCCVSRKYFAAVNLYACQYAVFFLDSCHLAAKAYLSSCCNNCLPHIFYHQLQMVCANMWLGLIQNFLRRAKPHKGFQHLATANIFNDAVQLAVGKSPCAPFAELHIGGGIQFSRLPEMLHIRCAPIHILPAFQENRPVSLLCQKQRGKQPRRSCPNHHRRMG